MKRICLKNECIGCLNCYNTCKFSAIKLQYDELGFAYVEINEEKCVDCNLCKSKCPVIEKQLVNNLINECYACKNKDDDIRLKSSSGGLFYNIANYIIAKGGVVYGAAYDNKFNVIHERVTKSQDIEKLMGSKYIQSQIKNIFCEVKKDLENKLLVLFTGTPCQMAALKKYLSKEYDNLYLQDFICHGVGSKKVLDVHISEVKEKYKLKNITGINFRDKVTGWKKFSMSIYADNGTYSKALSEDNYTKTFLKNLCLRSACYKCKYKGDNRYSDITLADFWGVDKVLTAFDDDKGTSALIINTNKGKEIFKNISDNFVFQKVKYSDIRENNICLDNPPIYNRHRNDFIKDINRGVKLSKIKKEYFTR